MTVLFPTYPRAPQRSDHVPSGFPQRTRWWKAAGSTTAPSALAGTASAGTVQISLTDVHLSIDLGDTITPNADLTGDGNSDMMPISNGVFSDPDSYQVNFRADLGDGFDTFARAGYSTGSVSFSVEVEGKPAIFQMGQEEVSILVPIIFTDARINNGAPTNGLLEITARNLSKTNHQVELVRLVFDNASTTEPTDAVVGGTDPAWVDEAVVLRAAAIARVQRKIRAFQRRLRKARANGSRRLVQTLRKRLRIQRRNLRAL